MATAVLLNTSTTPTTMMTNNNRQRQPQSKRLRLSQETEDRSSSSRRQQPQPQQQQASAPPQKQDPVVQMLQLVTLLGSQTSSSSSSTGQRWSTVSEQFCRTTLLDLVHQIVEATTSCSRSTPTTSVLSRALQGLSQVMMLHCDQLQTQVECLRMANTLIHHHTRGSNNNSKNAEAKMDANIVKTLIESTLTSLSIYSHVPSMSNMLQQRQQQQRYASAVTTLHCLGIDMLRKLKTFLDQESTMHSRRNTTTKTIKVRTTHVVFQSHKRFLHHHTLQQLALCLLAWLVEDADCRKVCLQMELQQQQQQQQQTLSTRGKALTRDEHSCEEEKPNNKNMMGVMSSILQVMALYLQDAMIQCNATAIVCWMIHGGHEEEDKGQETNEDGDSQQEDGEEAQRHAGRRRSRDEFEQSEPALVPNDDDYEAARSEPEPTVAHTDAASEPPCADEWPLPIILNTLSTHFHEVSVFGNCICLLSGQRAASTRSGSPNSDRPRMSLETETTLLELVKMGMKVHKASAKAQEACLRWLRLRQVRDHAPLFESLVPIIVETMQCHPSDPNVQGQACEVLVQLLDSAIPALRMAVQNSFAVDCVLRALREHGLQSTVIQHSAIWFLTLLLPVPGIAGHEDDDQQPHLIEDDDELDAQRESEQAACHAFGGGFLAMETIWKGVGIDLIRSEQISDSDDEEGEEEEESEEQDDVAAMEEGARIA